MKWLSSLLGSRAKATDGARSEGTQPITQAGDAVTRTYNEAVSLFEGRKYSRAEDLFLRTSVNAKSTAMRRAAAGAAAICRVRRGLSFSPDLIPEDIRDDANGLAVAFLAVNLAALQLQLGRPTRVRAEDSTWYVNTEASGFQYEFRVINMFGTSLSQAFRVDAEGNYLYLDELEQDPEKAGLLRPSDPGMSAWLGNNVKVGSLHMAPLPSSGSESLLTDDNYGTPESDVKVEVINLDSENSP